MSAVAPALVFALPLIDSTIVFFTRVSHKQNPFKADRCHLHYKLLDVGFSQAQSVTIIYISSALCCAAAIVSLYHKPAAFLIVGFVCIFLLFLKHINKIIPALRNNSGLDTAPEDAKRIRDESIAKETVDISGTDDSSESCVNVASEGETADNSKDSNVSEKAEAK